jgi:hypothetical protein
MTLKPLAVPAPLPGGGKRELEPPEKSATGDDALAWKSPAPPALLLNLKTLPFWDLDPAPPPLPTPPTPVLAGEEVGDRAARP